MARDAGGGNAILFVIGPYQMEVSEDIGVYYGNNINLVRDCPRGDVFLLWLKGMMVTVAPSS